jgi:hypothetical protein
MITCEHEEVSPPSQEDCEEKAMHIAKASAHAFSDSEIYEILKRKKEIAAVPRNLAIEKADLLRQRDIAENIGDSEKLTAIDAKLAALKELAEEQRRNQLDRETQQFHRIPQLMTDSSIQQHGSTSREDRTPFVPFSLSTDEAASYVYQLTHINLYNS